ncbi:MAG: GAF domain-containing protein, partial [Okeania sp. SIO3B3]|nr:GAF domain-containing protein [Okeania sp. SIO3B3]
YEIEKIGSKINTITLAALNQIQINKLVAETLKCTEKLALPLSQLVYQKSHGNPFFATQFLKALHQDKLIKFNFDLGCWECEITQVTQQAVTDDVVEFMALQLEKLPLVTQKTLKLAACIGNQFDLGTLAIVSEHLEVETATYLWKALQEGLILPISEVYKFYQGEKSDRLVVGNENTSTQLAKYKFLHDRVQQAAYSLIPDDYKQKTHYHIGQLLLQQISPEARVDRIFELVNQLNYGTSLITQQTEREELAQLNLIACRKARSVTAYQAGREYAETGLSLLTEKAWQQEYEISLAFHNLAAELAFLCSDFEIMEKFIEAVITQARSLLDRVNVYRIKIQASASQNKLTQAVAIARQFLEELGVTFPETPTEEDIQQAIAEIERQIGDRNIEDLAELPEMTDVKQIAIVQIANGIMPAVYLCTPSLFPLLVCTTIKLSIEYGNTPASAYSYSCYGLICCKLFHNVDIGVKFGQLALQVISKLNAKAIQPEVATAVGSCILHRKSHMRTMLTVTREGYETALEIGNVEFAGYTAHIFCLDSFWCNQLLPTLQQETSTFCKALVQFNQLTSANYCRLYWQSTLNLMGVAGHPTKLSGEALQEAELLPQMLEANDLYGLYFFYLSKLMLCYLFGEIESAQNYAVEIKPYFEVGTGSVGEPAFYFYDSLTALAVLSSSSEETAELFEQVEQNQAQMQQNWASYAPMNYQHKVDLVEAEKCRVLGQKTKALELYDKAISGAKENEYIQEEALANELAAKFYLDWSKEKVASGYMQEAYYCYARWGAKAKTDELEKLYPQLLQPILQQQRLQLNSTETIGLNQMLSPTYTNGTSSNNISDVLDFTSVLKAAQAISSSLELDQLIASLTRIIIENSGAKKAVLMLPQDHTWQVKAITLVSQQEIQTTLVPQLLDSSPDIPIHIIHYVKNTKQTVLINNCQTNIPGLIGEYMLEYQPQSVLCTPIINHGNLVGILYLENQLTAQVFTRDRLSAINLLCTQAAISLENAQLYHKIREREKFLNSIYKGVSCLIFVVDARDNNQFEYTGWSKSCELAIGIPASEVLGKTAQEFFPPKEAEIVNQSYIDCSQAQIPMTNEKCLQLNNQENWWLTVLSPLKDKMGKVYRIVGTSINISDRKQAEAAVVKKSLELETALEELKQAQLHMIQSEKMSALGNLVAGVGHEMNNPLGFISASLEQAKPTIADIIEHLQLYQKSLTNKSDEIIDHAEEIDLDYSLEDLPKMIDSMTIASDRLKNISTSLRTFSRADRDYQVPFNIHEGIDSTLLILTHRLKANEKRPAIEVIKNYGNLPKVYCFPGQLNQVFMNIIANAIDALDESNSGLTFVETEANNNKITITTSMENQGVKISLADNGPGMNEEVKTKIFEHLFTTKDVGKGTGLGLAIARQIIVEKHDGEIHVNSRLGEGTEFIITLPK